MDGVRDAGAGDGSAALWFEGGPAREILIFFVSGCFSLTCGGSRGARPGSIPGKALGTGAGAGGTAASEEDASAASVLGKASSAFLLRAVLWDFVK